MPVRYHLPAGRDLCHWRCLPHPSMLVYDQVANSATDHTLQQYILLSCTFRAVLSYLTNQLHLPAPSILVLLVVSVGSTGYPDLGWNRYLVTKFNNSHYIIVDYSLHTPVLNVTMTKWDNMTDRIRSRNGAVSAMQQYPRYTLLPYNLTGKTSIMLGFFRMYRLLRWCSVIHLRVYDSMIVISMWRFHNLWRGGA